MIVYEGQRLTIEFYGRGSRFPADEFLEAQEKGVQAKAYALFTRLGDTGRIWDTTKFRILDGTDGIFEFKPTSTIRLMCFFAPGRRVIVTHGFIKKSQKTPRLEIDRAEQYRKDFRSQGG